MSSSSGSNTAGRSGRSPLASAPRPGNGSPSGTARPSTSARTAPKPAKSGSGPAK